ALKQRLDIRSAMAVAAGGIRIGEDNAAGVLGEGVEIDPPLVVQRQGAANDVIQVAVDRIEAVADRGHFQRLLMAEERLKRQGQDLIRAVANEYLFCLDAEGVGERLAKSPGAGIRVA